MIKLLYDNGYILDKYIISSKIERTINSSYFLEFDMPLSSDLSNIIKENMEIEASIPNNQTDIFRVRLIRKDLDTIYFYCTQVFFSLEDNFIEDTNIVSKDGLGAILQIGNNTQYPHKFNFYSDIGTTNNARMVRKNVVSAILGDEDNTFISRWGGELDIHKYNVKMLTKLGTDRGVTIEYKKNLTGFEGTIDYSTYYTRCMPQGYDGLFLDEKYVDSENININHPIIKVIEFPDIKVKQNDDSDGYATEEEAKQALRKAVKELYKQGADIPAANYEVNFIELSSTEEYKNYSILESIWLGDTVTVKHDNFNIKSRCVHYSFDPIVKRYNSISLGEASTGIIEQNNQVKDEINKVIDSTKSEFETALDAAIKEASDLINTGLSGYIVKTRNELLIMDTEDINTAKNVWRWNINGLGFSSTGYAGPYETALTNNGKIVLNEVTALKFTASLIESGVLKSINGKLQLNLDDEEFRFTHDESNTLTKIDTKGFYIEDENGETIASLASKESWSELKADKVFANNIENIYLGDSNLYVDHSYTGESDGTIEKPFNNFSRLKELLETSPIINKDLIVNVLSTGDVSDNLDLRGLNGKGTLKINFNKNLILNNNGATEAIYIYDCDLLITINGGRSDYNTTDGALLNKWAYGARFNKCKYVLLEYIAIDSTIGNKVGVSFDNTNGKASRIDFCTSYYGITATRSSVVYQHGNCGNCTNNFLSEHGALIQIGGSSSDLKPMGSYERRTGNILDFGTGSVPQVSSYRTPPPIPPTSDQYKDFTFNDYGYYSEGYGNWNSIGYKTIYQGNWGYGNNRGIFTLPNSSINTFLTNATVLEGSTITLQRENAGGYSSAQTIYLHGTTHTSASGSAPPVTKSYGSIGSLAWGQRKTFTLPKSFVQDLKAGTIKSVMFYTSDGSNYIKFSAVCTLRLKVNK